MSYSVDVKHEAMTFLSIAASTIIRLHFENIDIFCNSASYVFDVNAFFTSFVEIFFSVS